MPNPTPQHLTGALIAYLQSATPWAAAVVGVVHGEEAARDTPAPYVVIQKVDESTLPIMGNRYLDTRTYLLSLYATSRPQAEELGNQLRDLLLPTAAFTPPRLTFAEGVEAHRWRAGGDALELDPERGPLSEDFYAYRLPINFMISR